MFYLSKGKVGVIVETLSGDSLTALKIRPLLLLVLFLPLLHGEGSRNVAVVMKACVSAHWFIKGLR